MKNDNWYPWFPGDFKRDTGHLSLAEQGAYRNLLDAYYCNGPLPADDATLRRTSGMLGPQWANSRATLLAFFSMNDGVMRHKKCDLVIASREHIKNVRSEAGNAGSSARWGNGHNGKRTAKSPATDDKTMPSRTTTREEREPTAPLSSKTGEPASASATETPSLDGGVSSAPLSPPNGEARMVRTRHGLNDGLMVDRTPVRESTVPYRPWGGEAVAREAITETDANNPPIGADALAAALAAVRLEQEAAAARRAQEQAAAIEAERDRQLAAMGVAPIQADPEAAAKARARLAEIAEKRAQSG